MLTKVQLYINLRCSLCSVYVKCISKQLDGRNLSQFRAIEKQVHNLKPVVSVDGRALSKFSELTKHLVTLNKLVIMAHNMSRT